MREIEPGHVFDERYVVINGSSAGKEIVTSGTFSEDAASRLANKPSIMNPLTRKYSTMPGIDMPEDSKPENGKAIPGMDMYKYKK